MNQEFRDLVQSRVKNWALNIDDNGKRLILKRLIESGDPWKTITEIQIDNSICYDRCNSAITFMDLLKVPRLSTFQSVFETLKGFVDSELEKFNETTLINMLQVTIHFITIHELRSIPMSIIKKITVLPDKYLHFLAKNNFVMVG